MKLNTTIKTLCAAVALAASAAASAAPIYLDVGADYSASQVGACETCTGVKKELSIQYDSKTTLTFTSGSAGTFSTDFGWDLDTNLNTSNIASNFIDAFDPGTNNNGYGLDNFWALTFVGTAKGTFTMVGGQLVLSYSSGLIDMYVLPDLVGNPTAYYNFMDITIDGGSTEPGNTGIYGLVTSTDTAYKNLFHSVYQPSCAAGGNGFAQILDGCGEIAPILFTGDFNTFSPTISGTANPAIKIATGHHDGSVMFDVPEPASLALMGMGLLGLGAIRRRKTV